MRRRPRASRTTCTDARTHWTSSPPSGMPTSGAWRPPRPGRAEMADVLTVVNMIPNLSSGETNQDSEADLAVNPDNPDEIVGTTFTPSPNANSPDSPVFYSDDGGETWALRDLIAGRPVRDQTVGFALAGGSLYAGVLLGPGGNIATINFDILRTNDFTGLTTMTRLARRQNDDQPYVQASTVPSGPDAGDDRIYV